SRARSDSRASSDSDEEAVAEVRLEGGAEDLLGRRLDVVVDALELEQARLGGEDRVARARVVVARLAAAPDADDVAPAVAQLEAVGHDLVDAVGRQRERLAQVRVPDERQRRELIPDLHALRRLVAREDVVEVLDVERRAVAELHVALANLVG